MIQEFYQYKGNKIINFSHMFEGHISDVHSLAASDNILVSGSKDNEAFVWDLQTGKKFMELPGHPTTIRAVKIVPQYSLVVTGSSFHMRLWDLRIGKCETLFQSSGLVTDKYEKCGHHNYIPPGEDEIKAFDIDSTGHYLFSNSRGSIRCWDLRKQQAYGRISGDDEFHITSISVQSAENANDGVKVFCGHTRKNMEEYGTVSIFKTPYDQAKTVFPVCLPFDFAVTDVIPDEKVFFCSDIRGNVFQYSIADQKQESVVPRFSASPANKLCFIKSRITECSLLVAGFNDGVIKFYSYEDQLGLKTEGKIQADMNNNKILSLTSNSKQLFCTSGKKIIANNIVYNP